MLYPKSPVYNRLLDAIAAMPVVDCHEHMFGPDGRPVYKEPIAAILHWYYHSDLRSAAFGVAEREVQRLFDTEVPTDEKWPLFERLWYASEHTAYARVTRLAMKSVYGIDRMSRAALDKVAEKLAGMDEAAYFRMLDEANIRAILTDALGWPLEDLAKFLDGKKSFPSRWRPLIPLPVFHPTAFSNGTSFADGTIAWVAGLAGCSITSLDEFLEAVYCLFQRLLARGVVGIKDQSAYDRTLAYDLPTTAEAEKQFNRLLVDPRNSLGWPESKPLNDYLFHAYMRFARALDLPVQIHTGHMAGIRNRVDKANAAHFAGVPELHREVRFDLFHGNWPYLGDLLFLGKNYPNVAVDLCWLHIVDPAYAIELMARAVLTVPHTKIHAFGGDFGDVPEFAVAHLQIARQNIAAALTSLVEGGWLDEAQALAIAADWLFHNPNRFFNLGL
ncbi:MAG: amidohydrolase family protein [Chloroflexota bacterium]